MYQATKNSEHYVNILLGNDDIYVHMYMQIHRYVHTSKKQTLNMLLKCDISFWKICQKYKKIMGPKTEKPFWFAKSITKVRENVRNSKFETFEIWFKFKSLKIALHMLQICLLHSIFKASLLRHTLKILTKERPVLLENFFFGYIS